MPPLVRRAATAASAAAAVAGTNEAHTVFVVAISPQNADVDAWSKSRRGRGRGSGHGHGLEYGAATAQWRRWHSSGGTSACTATVVQGGRFLGLFALDCLFW